MNKKTIVFLLSFLLFSCSKNQVIEKNIQQTNISNSGILLEKSISSNTGNIIKENKLNNDVSITKYINNKIHFTKINYIPSDLVSIKSEFIIDAKGNQILRQESNNHLQKLAKDFFKEFKVKLKIVSAYRSYNYQLGIKQRGCGDLFCAKAGYSEHQSGLAFDMFETTTKEDFLSKPDLKKYFEWFSQNAYKYGFNNSYKNGEKIDGYAIEPWHWRYLGIDFAKELWEKNMTYGEYFNKFGER
ncbi:MAG: M15 family metallopeptidase [Candidatus Gracilibacteria bacterium]|nr:M15 family metallopeptidase [Candidatus Gracilibacteria bacterium]